uniref:Uncharacterized protein n=1 Tax=Oryza nivara TaxID=4536 RepID=A0A0E0IDM3_ORYNI
MAGGDEAGIEELLEMGKMAGAGGTSCSLFREEKVGLAGEVGRQCGSRAGERKRRDNVLGGGRRKRALLSSSMTVRPGLVAGWRDRKRASARSDSPDENWSG